MQLCFSGSVRPPESLGSVRCVFALHRALAVLSFLLPLVPLSESRVPAWAQPQGQKPPNNVRDVFLTTSCLFQKLSLCIVHMWKEKGKAASSLSITGSARKRQAKLRAEKLSESCFCRVAFINAAALPWVLNPVSRPTLLACCVSSNLEAVLPAHNIFKPPNLRGGNIFPPSCKVGNKIYVLTICCLRGWAGGTAGN